MLDLKISTFEDAISEYQEIVAKINRDEPYSSDEFFKKIKEIEKLRFKFSFIIDAINHTPHGKPIIDLYNDWKRWGENSWSGNYELPLVFLNKVGAYK